MDVVVAGRHQQLSERFRAHVSERLEKVEQLVVRVVSCFTVGVLG